MSSHTFHKIFFHINWHTKNDLPMITPKLEAQIEAEIRRRCFEMPGVYCKKIGGTSWHTHLVLQVEPTVRPSEAIGKLKGGVSHAINAQEGFQALDWERGYGIVSFAENQLAWVMDYVANQKLHHARGTISPTLEATDKDIPDGEGGEAG